MADLTSIFVDDHISIQSFFTMYTGQFFALIEIRFFRIKNNPKILMDSVRPISISGKLLFVLFTLLTFNKGLHAQALKIDAIEVSFPSQNGYDNLSSYSEFISNTKDPFLFRTQKKTILSELNTTAKEAFAIDFIFKLKDRPSHQFIAGIETATLTTDLFELSGHFQDSLSVTTLITSKREYFFLRSGYNYIHKPDAKFSVTGGFLVNAGIPVSSITSEEIRFDDVNRVSQKFTFFAKQSTSFGMSLSLGIRFKIIRNISASLTGKPGMQYQRIDGTPFFTFYRGVILGIHFNLKDQ
jgi:hypothetical protein